VRQIELNVYSLASETYNWAHSCYIELSCQRIPLLGTVSCTMSSQKT
jgi:hypothetical protein